MQQIWKYAEICNKMSIIIHITNLYNIEIYEYIIDTYI